jgi:hypothetical protein
MSESTMLWILGGMNAVTWLILGWIKMDIRSLWHRADVHGHVVICGTDKCKLSTGGVIVNRGKL